MSEEDCTCGDYRSYGSSIQGKIVAAMMPMGSCINCHRIKHPERSAKDNLNVFNQVPDGPPLGEYIGKLKADMKDMKENYPDIKDLRTYYLIKSGVLNE